MTGAFRITTEALGILSAATAVPLTATVTAGPAHHVPELAAQAHELLELALALRRTPSVYSMTDLAMEYQFTRPGPARDHLLPTLAPLDRHPDLLDLLRAFLDCGPDRAKAAARLGIHPNSVANRLRRIHRVTGLHLTVPEDNWRAALALLGRELAEHEDHRYRADRPVPRATPH
ncbi:PucR family transcriptional regulator [Nocardia gipuzkoensis]|uniref:PucR family transcriptional regulator n=1 Tax=Nocardia gipuzkoensis TaxID=2749991 RepID=UPI003EE1E848